MKIISKFQDYYDFSCGYFDNSTCYPREVFAVQDKNILAKLESIVPKYSYRIDDEIKHHAGIVILNNIMYPFVRVLIKGNLSSISYEPIGNRYFDRIFKFKGSVFEIDAPVAIYDPYGVSLPKGIKPINFNGSFYDCNYGFEKRFIHNAPLKPYKFPLDGRIVLQEIETFLNKHKEEMIPQVLSDNDIRDAKGFDKNSFRRTK
jgi:hypothetical protein